MFGYFCVKTVISFDIFALQQETFKQFVGKLIFYTLVRRTIIHAKTGRTTFHSFLVLELAVRALAISTRKIMAKDLV